MLPLRDPPRVAYERYLAGTWVFYREKNVYCTQTRGTTLRRRRCGRRPPNRPVLL